MHQVEAGKMKAVEEAKSLMFCGSDLVNQGSSVGVGLQQDAGPQLWVFATHQVAGETLEQGVLVANLEKTTRQGHWEDCMFQH